MSPALLFGECTEGTGELAAVIGEDLLDGRGQHGLDEGGELRGIFGGRARHGDGDGEAAVVVDGGEDVSAHTANKQHDGVERDAFAGRGGA